MTTVTASAGNTAFSAEELAVRVHRRAVEAVIWGIPTVNFELMFPIATPCTRRACSISTPDQ